MVRRADAGGGSPTLYGWAKVGHATVYEHEPRDIGLKLGHSMPGTFQASSIGCYKMCEKFWTLPMGLRVRRFDYLWNNWGLRFIWDEGTSIGKEEDRPFLSGLMKRTGIERVIHSSFQQ